METGKFRKRKINFSQVSNKALQDKTLSLKAKGLFALITSYISIPDFTLYKSFLMASCTEGRDAFNKAWNELKSAGYLKQYRIQSTNGYFSYEYEIIDEPAGDGFSVYGKSAIGKTGDGKSVSIKKNNEINTYENNIVINNSDVDYINSVIDTTNLTENEVGELTNKKQKDLKTLERYKNASFNVSYFMQSWANQKFHDEVVYKYDLPKEEYLQEKTPCDRAEEMILDVLCLKRYKLATLDALQPPEIRELFDAALGILEGKIRVAKTPEAYLIGVIDNLLEQKKRGEA